MIAVNPGHCLAYAQPLIPSLEGALPSLFHHGHNSLFIGEHHVFFYIFIWVCISYLQLSVTACLKGLIREPSAVHTDIQAGGYDLFLGRNIGIVAVPVIPEA